MNSVPKQHSSVLSGMRPTGRLHLGHYHGVLKNWIKPVVNWMILEEARSFLEEMLTLVLLMGFRSSLLD